MIISDSRNLHTVVKMSTPHECLECGRECNCHGLAMQDDPDEYVCVHNCDQEAYERERDRLEALREGDR